jgi:signal peptidase I
VVLVVESANTVAQHTAQGRNRSVEGGPAIDQAIVDELWMETYQKKGRCWWPVSGSSMAPLIHSGDRVLVVSIPVERVRLGDIIVFRRNGELIVHRVLKKLRTADNFRFMEKGDGTHMSGLAGGDTIVGRVSMIEGKVKRLNLNSPLSRLTSLVLSLWFRFSSSAVYRLEYSGIGAVNRTGRMLSPLILLASSILVRLCFLVWYPSGLLVRGDG